MVNQPFDDQEPLDEEAAGEAQEEHDRRGAAGAWRGWLISGALHALILLSMLFVVYATHRIETEAPPVRLATIAPPPKPPEKPKENRTLETTVELAIEAQSEQPAPISTIDLPVDNADHDQADDNPTPKGREEAVTETEMGGSGAFMAIGGGGGASGMFGSRSGGGRKRAVSHFGGSKASESAVEAALRWFKKHQSLNGCWDGVKYQLNCTENPKCEPGFRGANWGNETGTTALTAYAVLCYLGAGFDHITPNKYRTTVNNGVKYLLSVQQGDGMWGPNNYDNAIATMAMAEAFAMTGDPALKGPAQRGVDIILRNQNQGNGAKDARNQGYGDGLGWDYVGPDDRNDSSVTGWNVMALKSALAAGLSIGNGMNGAKQWLERAWKATNKDWAKLDPYTGQSLFPYEYFTAEDKNVGNHLACVGAVCAIFLGHHNGDRMLETLANHIMANNVPTAYPTNTYLMYYNTMAIFQIGGDRWKKWNDSVRDILVKAQHKNDGCFDGSWDVGPFPGSEIGRVLSTAYCCLSLEVYYRYAQVAGNAGGAHK